ncbi:MAG: hypothetical protein JRJ85_23715, partial [Deltaproteobacteria bacterium]|nr:hypothetical protein [Deltaproteobacteria bacterium]
KKAGGAHRFFAQDLEYCEKDTDWEAIAPQIAPVNIIRLSTKKAINDDDSSIMAVTYSSWPGLFDRVYRKSIEKPRDGDTIRDFDGAPLYYDNTRAAGGFIYAHFDNVLIRAPKSEEKALEEIMGRAKNPAAKPVFKGDDALVEIMEQIDLAPGNPSVIAVSVAPEYSRKWAYPLIDFNFTELFKDKRLRNVARKLEITHRIFRRFWEKDPDIERLRVFDNVHAIGLYLLFESAFSARGVLYLSFTDPKTVDFLSGLWPHEDNQLLNTYLNNAASAALGRLLGSTPETLLEAASSSGLLVTVTNIHFATVKPNFILLDIVVPNLWTFLEKLDILERYGLGEIPFISLPDKAENPDEPR